MHSSSSSDASLHFVVRHPEYTQTLGYRHFVQAALNELNKAHPGNAESLLHTAELALTNYTRHEGWLLPNGEKLLNTLPSHLRGAPQVDVFKKGLALSNERSESFRRGDKVVLETLWEDFSAAAKPVFGQAADVYYGFPIRELLAINNEDCMNGGPLLTMVRLEDKPMRGYQDIVFENYPEARRDPGGLDESFSIEIPNSGGRKLELMRLCGKRAYLADASRHIQTRQGPGSFCDNLINKQIQAMRESDICFVHPCSNANFCRDLIHCIEPLFNTLIAPAASKPEGNTPLPPEKEDALIGIYWLFAQSTTVMRGGSAEANIVLEHLAGRLREQGYDYEVPFTKEGVDLWAQAASTSLDTFKARFKDKGKQGFFDRTANAEHVEDYLRHRFTAQAELAVADKAGLSPSPS